MTLNDVTELELEELDSTANAYMHTVRTVAEEIRGEKVWMTLNKKDRYRLLTLKVWCERYKVTLKYILQTLLPVWEQFLQKRTRQVRHKGLNVRIATLTGRKSLEILLTQIERDYPNQIQKLEWAEREKQRILDWEIERQQKDDIPTRTKTLLDFPHPKGYVRQYRHRIQNEAKLREQIAEEMQRFNYRNNPFLPETI